MTGQRAEKYSRASLNKFRWVTVKPVKIKNLEENAKKVNVLLFFVSEKSNILFSQKLHTVAGYLSSGLCKSNILIQFPVLFRMLPAMGT
jgi:hypothetical protein